MTAVKKVEAIREDLGKVGPVIAEQVEEAMLGRRKRLDTTRAERENEPVRRMLRFEQNVRERIRRLQDQLQETRRELRLAPENIESVVHIALALAGQPPLLPVAVAGIPRAFQVPDFRDPSWAPCLEGIYHPHDHTKRPIVFDAMAVKDRDDVVLAHLNHRLVQMCLRLLRAEIWAPEGVRKLHRVTARIVPDHVLDTPAVIAHARLVLVGNDSQRLHEEIISAGGMVREGRLSRMNVTQVQAALAAQLDAEPDGYTKLQLQSIWPNVAAGLTQALEARSRDRAAAIQKKLAERAGQEADKITNGEQWMLVFARADEPTGFATWHAEYWLEERVTLQAFRAFLGAPRFFAAPENESPEAMLISSADEQQEVTDQLGYQVRAAVEVLVAALDRADMDRRRELLRGIPAADLYEAALTAMMRLVFLLAAEERRLLPLGDELYDRFYAVSTLQAQLREASDQSGEEVIDLRFDAWSRLLATFRAVHGGVEHDLLSLVPYGGHLFDPDRFPFLEGRPKGTKWREAAAQPLPVSNRTVLHLLEALQYLTVRVSGGGPPERRRLSFRELDIEQIGHVYEGLLDHTARRAGEVVLGLAGTREKQSEASLAQLEALRARGGDALLEFLRSATGRQAATLARALEPPVDLDEPRFRAACGNDDALWERVRPFAALVRRNDVG
jgi:hypothetical protein